MSSPVSSTPADVTVVKIGSASRGKRGKVVSTTPTHFLVMVEGVGYRNYKPEHLMFDSVPDEKAWMLARGVAAAKATPGHPRPTSTPSSMFINP
jgi:ribosomal protein L24